MALKAVHVSDVPNLDHVPETPSLKTLYSPRLPVGVEMGTNKRASLATKKFAVIGHRGNGMNVTAGMVTSPFKENSILSFVAASSFPIDFIEFDVQVTKDDCPVIFHDDFILSSDNGTVFEKRVTELSVSEFLCYGPQREAGKEGKSLLRKSKDRKILEWSVEKDDSLCTLQEAFENVDPSLGFNVELKFDDHVVYDHDRLSHVLQSVLHVVFRYAKDRPIIFSSFNPDAALIVRKLQDKYPVYFLTNGGNEVFYDIRRNSLEEAIKVCLEGGLHGIVSEVKGVFRNPSAVPKIKDSNLSLLTYGKLNNVPEAVHVQYLMGIDGVIVDHVKEITESVSDFVSEGGDGTTVAEAKSKPKFSQQELSFLLKLIPELIQHSH